MLIWIFQPQNPYSAQMIYNYEKFYHKNAFYKLYSYSETSKNRCLPYK